MARSVRYVASFLTTVAPTKDLVASDRTDLPTAAIIICNGSTGSVANNAILSILVTDFTNAALLTEFDQHGVTTSQSGREHISATNQAVRLLDPSDGSAPFTTLRTATFARIAGGLRLTMGQTGTDYAVQVALFFEWNCALINSQGDGSWSTDEAIALAHTLNNPAGLGIVFSNAEFDDANSHMNLSIGMFRDAGAFDDNTQEWIPSITQQCAAYRWQDAQSTSNTAGQLFSNRISALTNNSGGNFSSQSITDNDINQVQITNLDGGATGAGFVALLFDTVGAEVAIDIIDLPTSGASDWEYNGVSFTPNAFFGLMTQFTAVGSGAGSALAGSFTLCGSNDQGDVLSIGIDSEDGVTTTNTSSHQNQTVLQNMNDVGTLTHQFGNFMFTSDGWDVAASDVTAPGGSAVKMLAAIFGEQSGGSINAITQVGDIPGQAVLFDNEINVKIAGSQFGSSGVVKLSDYDMSLGGSGNEVTQVQVSYSDTEIRFDVNKSTLTGSLYINVTPDGGSTSSSPVTVNTDAGTGTVSRRATAVSIALTEGVPVTPVDYSLYFHKTDAQDTVTYGASGLPTGTIAVGGTVLSGTIGAGANLSSPYTVTVTCTDSFGNQASDQFSWVVEQNIDLTPPDPVAPTPQTPKQRIYRFRVPGETNEYRVK